VMSFLKSCFGWAKWAVRWVIDAILKTRETELDYLTKQMEKLYQPIDHLCKQLDSKIKVIGEVQSVCYKPDSLVAKPEREQASEHNNQLAAESNELRQKIADTIQQFGYLADSDDKPFCDQLVEDIQRNQSFKTLPLGVKAEMPKSALPFLGAGLGKTRTGA
jgi:hypothetical protein